MQDFEDKDYNVKKAGYWELGRLGPDLATDELQAKRENQERVKALAAQVCALVHMWSLSPSLYCACGCVERLPAATLEILRSPAPHRLLV